MNSWGLSEIPVACHHLEMTSKGVPSSKASDVAVSDLVTSVIRSVDMEMRGKPASMVYEVLDLTLARRLPGIPVDAESMRQYAAEIAVGALNDESPAYPAGAS